MVKIGFPIPKKNNEHRRALLPCDIPRSLASNLVFESGYGEVLGIQDEDYLRAGASVSERCNVCECPVICNPKPLPSDEYFQMGTTLFGWIHAVQGRPITDALIEYSMTAIAWEEMFEDNRHSFWRNNEISG